MRRRRVVSCFLVRGGRVLLLRRSAAVGTYPGRWAAVSGTMEGPDALAEARREVREETGLGGSEVALRAAPRPLEVPDPGLGVVWEVHAVRGDLAAGAEPRLDWEHSEARWFLPRDLASLDTVPGLARALEAALHA